MDLGGGFSGDGGPATAAELFGPWAACKDAFGNIYISDNLNYRIRKVDTTGIINTIAGNGISGYFGNGGPATAAELDGSGICLDSQGNVYESDYANVIREVVISPTGIENVVDANSELMLFPNPTNMILNIKLSGQLNGLATLWDITGREVMSSIIISTNEMRIDVSSLSPGMYFLSVKTKDTFVTQKFIKQ
jgi:hypothetical protein